MAAFVVIIWIVFIGTCIWVLVDAYNIGVKRGQPPGFLGMGPWGWFFACLLLWLIAFPCYLAKRGEYKRIAERRRKAAGSTD